jgi:hypothetical protein
MQQDQDRLKMMCCHLVIASQTVDRLENLTWLQSKVEDQMVEGVPWNEQEDLPINPPSH